MISAKRKRLRDTIQFEADWELKEDWWAIEKALNNSICKCPSCFSSNRDMVFNPVLKQWFCISCYNANKKFEEKRGEGFRYP